jgi:hypothetical protein
VNHGALQPTTLLAFYGSGRMFTMLKRRRDSRPKVVPGNFAQQRNLIG